jgi:WhiB family transcriptional regulator, redox-sensing transcriptional regulator
MSVVELMEVAAPRTAGPGEEREVYSGPEGLTSGSFAAVDEGALGWQERALCAQTDPEAFFPEKGGSTREAKRVCLGCDVRSQCLEYALAHDERFGIWGGLSERERRRLKRLAV